jgi:UDP-2-acetamido-2,6-beta-L-arabino-hexul-4-ose reductase
MKTMLKIGITGQEGFVGKHLYNTLSLFPEEFERIPFKKDFFTDEVLMNQFVAQCDVIVHLAAMNRHENHQLIYDTNINLAKQLIHSLEATHSKAHVLFSSSIQEENDNLYGKSKKEGRQLIIDWVKRAGGNFTGMIIPNVFGPFGLPNYNSVIATFCYKLTHNENPNIIVDSKIKFIYIDELIAVMLEEIRKEKSNFNLMVEKTSEHYVSDILKILENFKEEYLNNKQMPMCKTTFEKNLFETFKSFCNI